MSEGIKGLIHLYKDTQFLFLTLEMLKLVQEVMQSTPVMCDKKSNTRKVIITFSASKIKVLFDST